MTPGRLAKRFRLGARNRRFGHDPARGRPPPDARMGRGRLWVEGRAAPGLPTLDYHRSGPTAIKRNETLTELEMLEQLRTIDTPTITNVVATYPGNDLCLGLYNPWTMNWYTDNTLGCWYPALGPMAGYAVTCVYGLPDPNFPPIDFLEVLAAIDQSPQPTVVAIEQRFPPELADKVGLSGGNMTSKMRAVGAIGAITNGPSRDIQEIRPMEFQYLTRGISPGHGPQAVQAVQVPVHIAGMDVAPGEIIHMDENGAVKFPADKLEAVLTNAKALTDLEEKSIGRVLEVRAEGLEALQRVMGSGDPYIKRK